MRLTAEQSALVEANTGLVALGVQRYGKGQAWDEAFQAGCLGLIRAAQKFEPERGFTFGTYAMFWIRAAMGRGFEGWDRPERRRVGWSEPVSLDSLEVPPLGGPEDVEAVASARVLLAAVRERAEFLCRDALDVRVVEVMTSPDAAQVPERSLFVALADEQGRAVQTIRNRWHRIRGELRVAFGRGPAEVAA